jgi:hypothetical protein
VTQDLTERAGAQKSDQITRLNLNINSESAEALRSLTTKKGITYTEAVRRAILMWKFFEDEKENDVRIELVGKNGVRKEAVLL